MNVSEFLDEYILERHGHGHGHHHDDDEGSPTAAKATAMAVLFLASFTIGCLPIKLSKLLKWDDNPKNNGTVQAMLCFGGGVLLCTTFLHLLPEVSEGIEELQEDGSIPDLRMNFASFLMLVGFFTMYLVEEMVHFYLHRRQKSSELNAVRRSLSIRRGEVDSDIKTLSTTELVKDVESSHNHSHGHSHVMVEDGIVQSIRGLLVVLALSVHELFEGLAVGLESSPSNVWYMFGAVAAHKLVIAFCIGVELVITKTKVLFVVIYVFTFAVVSPLGIGIGILVSEDQHSETDIPSVILQGLATGTLLYVVFFEILQSDRKGGLRQFFAVLVGFIVMLIITIFANNDLLFAKVIAMSVLGCTSFLIGLLPIKLTKVINIKTADEDKNLLISLLLCFGGGVLLFTTFLHLQPEVRQSFAYLESEKKVPILGHGISMPEIVFCMGFFFVYLIEELVHCFLEKRLKSEVLARSMSVRRKDSICIPRVTLNKVDGENNIGKELFNNMSFRPEHHHHTHGHIDENLKNSFSGLLAVLALSFHAVFEGLAVGLENSVQKVWYLFAAIATHKLVIAFCVGVELVTSKTKRALIVIYIGTFAIVTPLGIGTGIALSETGTSEIDVTSVVLQGMAAGTLLYVVFFEVLARERNNKHGGIWQLLAIIAGFSVMFVLQILTGHEHDHGHEHGHESSTSSTPETLISQTKLF